MRSSPPLLRTKQDAADQAAIPYRRHRGWVALCIVVVVIAGLASRKFPAAFPAAFGSYTGDALWALMVFLGMALLWPATGGARLAGYALAFAYLIEISQLYQAPWANALRATSLGHLVLGTGFQWRDLIAYAVGVGVGVAGDLMMSRWKMRRS